MEIVRGFIIGWLCVLNILVVAETSISGIPGALDDAAMVRFYNDSSTRASGGAIAGCKAYADGEFVPWDVVAHDWVVGGGRTEDCAAALIIASGETSCKAEGCASVKSGIWQVTSPDMPPPSKCPDGDTNPCCTVDYVRNHLYTRSPGANKTTSFQVGCMGEFNDGNGWSGDPKNPNAKSSPSKPKDIASVVGPIVPADHSGGGLGGTQSNWIGPFCHQGGLSCEKEDPYCHSKPQTGISGDNWGGGSVWMGMGHDRKQIFPFPYYYYAKFVESQGDGKFMTGDMHCVTMGGSCGGIPAKNQPDCPQPINGKAPSDLAQACLNGITSAEHCAASLQRRGLHSWCC